MTTEQYSIGYDAGYQDGFDAALANPMKQEPVAWMEDSIEFYAKDHPTSSCTIPLYTTPPTAAIASRQMRDAAVNLCKHNGHRQDGHDDAYARGYRDGAYDCEHKIAALPVPEVQEQATAWPELIEAAVLAEREACAKVIRNEAGQIAMQKLDGSYFDISKHIGHAFYTTPPTAAWDSVLDKPYMCHHKMTDKEVAFADGWNALRKRLLEIKPTDWMQRALEAEALNERLCAEFNAENRH